MSSLQTFELHVISAVKCTDSKLFFFPCLHPPCRMKQFLRKLYDQHVMSVGQGKNLSPHQDWNLCPRKHRAGALFT